MILDATTYNLRIDCNVVLSRDKREKGSESSIVPFKGFRYVREGLGSSCHLELKCFCIKRDE